MKYVDKTEYELLRKVYETVKAVVRTEGVHISEHKDRVKDMYEALHQLKMWEQGLLEDDTTNN